MLERATTRAICAEAGMHQSVFHYCVDTKEELHQELVRVVVVDMVDSAVLSPEISLILGWLTDRNNETAEAALRHFAD